MDSYHRFKSSHHINDSPALGVGLFAASRLLHSFYWWADHSDKKGGGTSPAKAARRYATCLTVVSTMSIQSGWHLPTFPPNAPHCRKQLAALSVGSVVVSGLCYAGLLATRGRMRRLRDTPRR